MANYRADTIPNEDEIEATKDISFVIHPSTWEFIRDRLDRGGRVLDVGCGNGTLLWNVEYRTPSSGYGLDLSDTRTRVAAKTICNGRIATADGARSPFPSESFDVIVCLQIIEHIVDRQGFIAGLYEMLKPGGILVISSIRRGKYRWYYLRDEHGEIVLDKGHVYEFSSLDEFNRLILSANTIHPFVIIRSFEYQVRFSALDFIFKRLHRLFRTSFTRSMPASRIGIASRKVSMVPIPGYFCTDVVAERREL